jgi:hypothetical protein
MKLTSINPFANWRWLSYGMLLYVGSKLLWNIDRYVPDCVALFLKTAIFIHVTMRTSNLTVYKLFYFVWSKFPIWN